MDRAQTKRGGDADRPRSRPHDKVEDKEEKLLGDELDDSFPASDPPPAPSRSARSRPPRSRASRIDLRCPLLPISP